MEYPIYNPRTGLSGMGQAESQAAQHAYDTRDRYAGLSNEEMQAAAEMLARRIPFLRGTMGKLKSASKRERELAAYNAELTKRGLGPIAAEETLTPEELRQAWMQYGTGSPKKAAQADVMLRQLALENARGSLDTASQVATGGLYPQALAFIHSQLAHPEAITEAMQRKIEGGIRHTANRADAAFESRLRSNLGARGLPGAPGQSGPGIRSLAGFERILTEDTSQQVADAQIKRALANKDYETMISRLAMAAAANDPQLQLLRDKASLESGVALSPSGVGFGDYASLLAALQAKIPSASSGPGYLEGGASAAMALTKMIEAL